MAEKIVKDSQGLVNDLVNDCISRKAAIDAVMRNACNTQRIYEAIKGLPSEQPETHDKRTGTHACDLIDRAEAIEAIEKHIRTAEEPYQLTDADKVMNHAFEIAASCVYNLSAAQPERKRGKWKPYRCDMYECSECGYIYTELTDRHRCGANFCPHCGADMRKDAQE